MKLTTKAFAVGSVIFLTSCSEPDRELYSLGQGLIWEYQISMLGSAEEATGSLNNRKPTPTVQTSLGRSGSGRDEQLS